MNVIDYDMDIWIDKEKSAFIVTKANNITHCVEVLHANDHEGIYDTIKRLTRKNEFRYVTVARFGQEAKELYDFLVGKDLNGAELERIRGFEISLYY